MNKTTSKPHSGILARSAGDTLFNRNRITFRLVNAASNKSFLEDKPHRLIEDLAVIYYIALDRKTDGALGLYITLQLLESMDMTEDDLYRIALKNMKKKPACFMSLRSALAELLGTDPPIAPVFPGDSLYLFSNEERHFGAATILDAEAMREVAGKIGRFYILPSSVHETILLPADCGIDAGVLSEMVKEINQTQVEEHERLSDHVYICDADTGSFSLCSEEL